MGLEVIVQGILFAIFSGLTGILSVILGPTYDGLLVPELSPDSLYPALSSDGGSGFFQRAVDLSGFVVGHLVDPVVPLLALSIGILYLARAVLPQLAVRTQSLVPKLVFSVILANFSLPVAGAILGIAHAGYGELVVYDGGSWQHWMNLAGPGFLVFSWDNGALAFVLTFVLFALVLLLAAAIAVRDALLAVLVVLLPLFTLVYPIPSLAPLARRGWLLFGQLAFLPWVVLVPLELAVRSGSAPLLVGYLTVALAAPGLLALAGSHAGAMGFPAAGSALTSGVSRGLSLGASAGGSVLNAPVPRGGQTPSAATALRAAGRTAASVPMPVSLPFFAAEMAGHGAARLFRHIPSFVRDHAGRLAGPRFPAIHPHWRNEQ